MSELSLNEAHKLWMEKLSNKCKYRRASTCEHDINLNNLCRIQSCPILYKAKLRMEIEYKFKKIT